MSRDRSLGMLFRNKYIMTEFLIVGNHKSIVLTFLKGTYNLLHTSIQYSEHHTLLPLAGSFFIYHDGDLITMHGSLGCILRYKDILRFSLNYYKPKTLLGCR